MNKRIAGGLFATALIVLGATGCGASKSAGPAASGSSNADAAYDTNATLRVAQTALPTPFDPTKGTSQTLDFGWWSPVYDRLIELKADGSLGPMLATSWTLSADKRNLDVKLRTDVTFQDGTPFNADAVVANITRNMAATGTLAGNGLANVASVTKVSDSEVNFATKADGTILPYTLAASIQCGAMVSPKALANPATLATSPVGTGPYKVTSIGQTSVTYQRVDNYWNKELLKTAPKTIEMTAIVDDNAKLNALKSGQVDVMAISGVLENPAQVAKSNDLKLITFNQSSRTLTAYANLNRAPLSNPVVRQALSMAIDRDAIASLLGTDACLPSLQPFGPGTVGYDPALKDKVKGYYNPAKAKQMLADAGATNANLKILAQQNQLSQQVSTVLQAQLKQAGVNVTIETQPSGTAAVSWRAGGFDFFVTDASGAPDPSFVLDQNYVALNALSPPNAVKQLAEAARYTPLGSNERNQAYQKVSGYLVDNPTNLIICSRPPQYLSRSNVGGVEKEPLGPLSVIMDARNMGILKK